MSSRSSITVPTPLQESFLLLTASAPEPIKPGHQYMNSNLHCYRPQTSTLVLIQDVEHQFHKQVSYCTVRLNSA